MANDHQLTADRRTVTLFGMTVDALTMDETVAQVRQWCASPRGDACRYVVTPNVDHAVMFQTSDRLRAAYADAALVLADGAPVVAASRLLRRPVPERVAGSDLAPAVFESAACAWRKAPAGVSAGRRPGSRRTGRRADCPPLAGGGSDRHDVAPPGIPGRSVRERTDSRSHC
ncbi:MAG TPA: WecB/TagA/CpsF family glycosyltransferase [Lacipirellulaceae bacterium]|nr:WecB/TagA/CpsF family glycosyltransferase [Lacipirellulaceae bacterium]